jgi:class 3 adenylate cyclase/tetratricopeptide (TPR) repeat protein
MTVLGSPMTVAPELRVDAPNDLTPYVPRVVIEWLRTTPEAHWRELEGTLAFIDLSGFTAMSERLAALGKAGAEEVTEVMNATFARLLDVAYENSGGLLKFGGDALLLFFSEDDHAACAARAAFGMRRALREIGRPKTSAGTVTLRMHAGLHSGSFDFFLVGRSHRELLLAGPGVTTTVAMEAASEAGEILVSPATAAALPARALGDEKDGGRLLKADVPTEGEGLLPLPPVEGLDLGVCVPPPIRDTLLGGAVDAEHRQATVAFVRFSGTDELFGEGGASAVSSALGELVERVQVAADEHGVTFLESDIDRDGGRIILVAGAPQTKGDDEERLLRTARAVVDASPRLDIRIGVNRGRVFAGQVGAPFRRTYTVLGDTAALAARLMAKAEAGQVLAAPEVLERSRTDFDTVELAPFRVKGKAEPVVAHDVRAVAARRDAVPDKLVPFVGRERELAIIGASLAPVRMGFGSLVELTGEPGMGKSRLVDEIKAQCSDMTILSAACEEYEQSTPYFACRGLLRALLDVTLDGDPATNTKLLRDLLEPIAPELIVWIPLLAIPLDVETEPTREVEELQPAFRRARLHGVVEELMAKRLGGPTLLVFEDVHWMDEASSELLRHLGTQVTRRPWLLCATRRPVATGFHAATGVPPLPAMAIMLEPLTDAAAAALLAAAGDGSLPPHELAAITERGAGNPLFLQELVRSPQGEQEEALPETIESVVTARIDNLDPGDRTLLRLAAVLGASFDGALIEDVLSREAVSVDPEAWTRLAEFLEHDPYTAGAFRFRHALFRDAAYEGLPYRRRRELHAQVGKAYEQRFPDQTAEYAELLSLHFLVAQTWEKAWSYSLVAAERARAKHANVEAAAFYRRALDVSRRLPALDRRSVSGAWEALGDVLELAGNYPDAAVAYGNARRLVAKDVDLQPLLLLKEGLIRERSARYVDALRWYKRGLRAVELVEDEELRRRTTLELRLAYAGVRLRQGNFADCVEWCKQVTAEADFAEDLAALAHAYYLSHLAYTSIGSPEKEGLRGLALPIYEDLGDLLGQANVLNNLGIDAYYDGRWDEALDLYERSRHLRQRIGDVVGAATITNNIGEIELDQGRLEAAEQSFKESLAVFEESGYRYMAYMATGNLGTAAAHAGRAEDGRELLVASLEGFQEIGAASFVLETQARLAACEVLAGDSATAFQRATKALDAIGTAGTDARIRSMLQRVGSQALLQQGDIVGAEAAVEESILIARGGHALFQLAQSLETRGRLRQARGADASADDEEATELFAKLGVMSRPPVATPPLP